MKIAEVMTTDVGFCLEGDDLTRAAEIMRLRNCGAVPVVDEQHRVLGMISDRDIGLTVAARDQKASEIKAGEIIRGEAVVSAPHEKIKDALKKMRRNRVKRLAVTDEDERLVGIVSLSDILLYADEKKSVRQRIFSVLKSQTRPEQEKFEPRGRIVLEEQTAAGSVDE